MAWCNESPSSNEQAMVTLQDRVQTLTCPSCNHNIPLQDQAGVQDLPGLPAGVKFDPSDQVILQHLEAKVLYETHDQKLIIHPLIHKFIPTLEGENGICYTHPEKLPGVNKDGQIRHFFHRPLKAYTTGTRKRRKVHTNEDGGETRWHKTGKTRPVFIDGTLKGFKKILVLYTNYGRQKKPEKTNWVMHQYHLGDNEEEKDGELVVSKVFYQTQPRQCAGNSSVKTIDDHEESSQLPNKLALSSSLSRHDHHNPAIKNPGGYNEFNYNPNCISFDNVRGQNREIVQQPQLIPNLTCEGDHGPLLFDLPNKGADKGTGGGSN